MSDAPHDPPRWKDDVEHGDVAERAVGHAIRCARAVPPRRAPSLGRVVAGIRASQSPRRLTWVVVTAAFILGLATAASAARLDLLPSWLTRIVKTKVQPPESTARPSRAKARARTATTSPAATTEPSVPPGVIPPAGAPPAPSLVVRDTTILAAEPKSAPRVRKVAVVERAQQETAPAKPGPGESVSPESATVLPAVPPTSSRAIPFLAPPEPSAATWPELAPASSPWPAPAYVPAERPAPSVAPAPAPAPAPPPEAKKTAGQYLGETVRLLRAERSPAQALRFLDGHAGELAHGGLAHEALILRVEALLALDRRTEVLRLLDGASLSDVAASRALLVTRGQLRAAANRCGDGIGDFDLVLARSTGADRQALIGRALCRKRLGDGPGSKADVQRLLDQFPGQPLPAELAK